MSQPDPSETCADRQDEDPEEFYSNSGIAWRLSKVEYNAVLEQRE